jgi:hypothetical protein
VFDGIRDHLLQAAELKFNVFFLLPLVDAFPDALRNTTEAAWEGDVEVGKGGWGGGCGRGGTGGRAAGAGVGRGAWEGEVEVGTECKGKEGGVCVQLEAASCAIECMVT